MNSRPRDNPRNLSRMNVENEPADLLYILHSGALRIVRTAILCTLFVAFTAACTAVAQDLKAPAQGVNGTDWQQQAVRKYPDLGVEGSDINKLFVQKYRKLRSMETEYFAEPDWPIRLADECARELNLHPSQSIPNGQVSTDRSPARRPISPQSDALADSSVRPSNEKEPSASGPRAPLPIVFTAVKWIIFGVIGFIALGCAGLYLRGWLCDPIYSFAACFVSFLAGCVAFAVCGWLSAAWVVFLLCHLLSHGYSGCEQCGASHWRHRTVLCEAVGEKTIITQRERVQKHYDSRGNLIGTTKQYEEVPETRTVYQTTRKCKRCGHLWSTTD